MGRKPPNFNVVERGDKFVQYAYITDETSKRRRCSEVYGLYRVLFPVHDEKVGADQFWVIKGEPITKEGWVTISRLTPFLNEKKYHGQPIVPLAKEEFRRFLGYYNKTSKVSSAFRFASSDFDLCDGTKKNSRLLRERFLLLYKLLLPKLLSDSALRAFVKSAKARNKLTTKSPYVPTFTHHSGGYKSGSWIGFADPITYPDPRVGIQFQYGISDDSYWYGIWVQGDQPTRKTEHAFLEVLRRYNPKKIAASMRTLGNRYRLRITRDEDGKRIISKVTSEIKGKDIEQFLANLERKRLWIRLDKILTRNELKSIADISSDILRTTHELLDTYRWWTGAAPRGMTEEEAYNQLKKGKTIKVEGEGTVPTDEREGVANLRVGQTAMRRYALEVYGHQCALCDINSDELLRASHIVPWKEDEANRGNPRNVICLCSSHDLMFERGFLKINPDYNVTVGEKAKTLTEESQMFLNIWNHTLRTVRPTYTPPDPGLLRRKIRLLSRT